MEKFHTEINYLSRQLTSAWQIQILNVAASFSHLVLFFLKRLCDLLNSMANFKLIWWINILVRY